MSWVEINTCNYLSLELPLVHWAPTDEFVQQTGRKRLTPNTFLKRLCLQAIQISS